VLGVISGEGGRSFILTDGNNAIYKECKKDGLFSRGEVDF